MEVQEEPARICVPEVCNLRQSCALAGVDDSYQLVGDTPMWARGTHCTPASNGCQQISRLLSIGTQEASNSSPMPNAEVATTGHETDPPHPDITMANAQDHQHPSLGRRGTVSVWQTLGWGVPKSTMDFRVPSSNCMPASVPKLSDRVHWLMALHRRRDHKTSMKHMPYSRSLSHAPLSTKPCSIPLI